MLNLRFLDLNLNILKERGKSLMLLPFFLLLMSCAQNLEQYGSITLHSSVNQNSFIFRVTDEFLQKNSKSEISEKNSKITKAESKLLSYLLKKRRYCLNIYGKPSFTVTSRQEKVYDITFAHLIEQNYNARAIAPRTYFGRCDNK